jgi:rod shape-determining protein MreC
METILGRFRNLIVLAAILFAQIVGLAVQVKRPAQQGDTRLIRVWAAATITPLERAVVNTQKFFHDAWFNYAYLRGVRRENRALRAEMDQMKLEQVRLKEDAEMARRIQSLLAFKEQHIDSTVAAQVIGTSGSDQSRVLYIDKGSSDGLRPDMAVITPNGIVGKIVQVFPDSAQVLPINDQLSGVGVSLKSTRLQGILRGAVNGTTTVQYVMADERVIPGEEVVTSGGDRIFPKGLPVGKVLDVQPGKDLFLNIRVQPSAPMNRLEEVLVVTKVTEKPPDVQDLGPIRASDILAQRLPTVPSQPQVDANGNAAGPAATGTSAATKPTGAPAGTTAAGQAVTAASGTRPAGSLVKPTSGTGAPTASTAAPTGSLAKKPTSSVATKPAPPSVTGTTGTTTQPKPSAAVGDATETNPAPTRKPADENVPTTNPNLAQPAPTTDEPHR